ncbi:MAG: DUF4230 domain-containing protein, partial [Lewinella sp.]
NINEGVNALRESFRQDALESNVMDRAKTQAASLMDTMFGPIVSGIGGDYTLVVSFRGPTVRTTQGELGK